MSRRKLVSFWLDEVLDQGLRTLKARTGVGASELIRQAITALLAAHGVTSPRLREAGPPHPGGLTMVITARGIELPLGALVALGWHEGDVVQLREFVTDADPDRTRAPGLALLAAPTKPKVSRRRPAGEK